MPLPFRSAPADRRSDPPIVRYQPLKSTVAYLFWFFSHVKISPILRRSAQTPTFSEPRGSSYGPKCLSSLVSPSVRRKDDPSPPLRSSCRDSRFEKKKLSQNSTRRPQKPPGKLSLPCFPHPPFKVMIKPQSMHQNANPTIRIERRRQF